MVRKRTGEQARTDRLRARLAALAPVYSDLARAGGSPGVDVVEDMHAVRDLISGLTATCEVEISILTLMANGLKDDVIAKRMGLSVRACRGHIAELMETFGARSRFQAGVIAAGLGLLEPKGVGGASETGIGL